MGEHQVHPFNISTSDGETLYAWHVLPLGVYTKNKRLLEEYRASVAADVNRTPALRILAESNDPESLLVINCARPPMRSYWIA